MMLKAHTMVCTSLSIGLAAAISQGAVLMLDFGATLVSSDDATNSPLHAVKPSFTGATWNRIQTSDVGSLKYADDTAATGVSVNIGRESGDTTNLIDLADNPTNMVAAGTGYSSGIYSGTAVARDALYTSANDRASGVQIVGLAAGEYNLYLAGRNTFGASGTAYPSTFYAAPGVSGDNFDFSTLTSSNITNGVASTAWVAGDTYTVISVTITSGQVINVAVQGAGTSAAARRGFISNLQIELVPEPASLGLLALGGLLIGRRRRG